MRINEPLDQLYVLGNLSKHDDSELRYSLRSLEKYCTGYGRVFVVGWKPDWLKNVVFIPCENDQDAPHKNILKKIQMAVRESDISENFVYQADDHFYVRPYDFRDIGLYEKGRLPVSTTSDDGYRLSLVDTCHWLGRNGYPAMNCSQHCGFLFNKTVFKLIENELVRQSFAFRYGIEPSSMMAAALRKWRDIPYTHRDDLKIAEFENAKDLRAKIGDNFCFSIYDRAFESGLKRILARWYPKKSKYE